MLINNKLILFNLDFKLNNNNLIAFNLNLFKLNSLKLNYINEAVKEELK